MRILRLVAPNPSIAPLPFSHAKNFRPLISKHLQDLNAKIFHTDFVIASAKSRQNKA
jgi:hypothetical protein